MNQGIAKIDRKEAVAIAKSELGWLTAGQFEVARCAAVCNFPRVDNKTTRELYGYVEYVPAFHEARKIVAGMLRRNLRTDEIEVVDIVLNSRECDC